MNIGCEHDHGPAVFKAGNIGHSLEEISRIIGRRNKEIMTFVFTQRFKWFVKSFFAEIKVYIGEDTHYSRRWFYPYMPDDFFMFFFFP
jgi:hypothetical protein